MRINSPVALKHALASATSGDEIHLSPGEFLGPFQVTVPVSIIGSGPATVLYHPLGPVLHFWAENCRLADIRLEITEISGNEAITGSSPDLDNVEVRASRTGAGHPSLPAAINLDDLPPDATGVWIIHIDTPVPLDLSCPFNQIAIIPESVPAGSHAVRLRLSPRSLDDGMMILTRLTARSSTCRYDIPMFGKVRSGAEPSRPSILVPNDVPTIENAIDKLEPGDRIALTTDTYVDSLALCDDIEIVGMPEGVEQVKLIVRCESGLRVLSGACLKNLDIVTESGGAISCIGGAAVIERCNIKSENGDGLVVAPGASAIVFRSMVSDCRGSGIRLEANSKLDLTASMLVRNRRTNLVVSPGATVTARKSSFQSSHQGSGVTVGGTFRSEECIFFMNARSGLWVESSATVEISKGQIEENGDWGIRQIGSGLVEICGTHIISNRKGAVYADTPSLQNQYPLLEQ